MQCWRGSRNRKKGGEKIIKKKRLQKVLITALAVTTVFGMTMTAGATGTALAASSSEPAAAAVEEIVVVVIPTIRAVIVETQKIVTIVEGDYLAKTVDGVAVMTLADSIKSVYGPVLNIDFGYRENGKYTNLSTDGGEIIMAVVILV